MKLIGLAASYRAFGNNQTLVNLAAKRAKENGAEVTALSFPELDVPLFRESDEATSIPKAITRFEQLLLKHDGILLAAPEHNWSFPASLKNVIDWLSVLPSKPLNGKTALLLCASPSKRGGILGLQQLRVPLGVLGVWVHPQMVAIGNAYDAIQEGNLIDDVDELYLQECVADFVRTTMAMKGR